MSEENKQTLKNDLFKVIDQFREDNDGRKIYDFYKKCIDESAPKTLLETRAMGMDIINTLHGVDSSDPMYGPHFKLFIMGVNYAVMAYQYENDLLQEDGTHPTHLLVDMSEIYKEFFDEESSQ